MEENAKLKKDAVKMEVHKRGARGWRWSVGMHGKMETGRKGKEGRRIVKRHGRHSEKSEARRGGRT